MQKRSMRTCPSKQGDRGARCAGPPAGLGPAQAASAPRTTVAAIVARPKDTGLLPASLETHHVLNNRLALLGDLARFPGAVGAVFAKLLRLARHLHRHELFHFVAAFLARRHDSPF